MAHVQSAAGIRGNKLEPPARCWLVFPDVAMILALTAAVVAISASGPSTTYRYAQLQQIGAVVGTVHAVSDPPGAERSEKYGSWLLPRDQMGGLARKPQLYAWLGAATLMLTGTYNDFTFCLPTVVAAFVAAVLVYFLARRWHGRRAGLLAACLWVAIHHMGKLMYVAVTDMLLTVWIIASVMCADRLLFHRAAPGKQRWWAVGLWITMILGAMTKGWGVLNLILVGLMLALATAVGPGFGAVRHAGGVGRKLLVVLRLILRRWRRAIKATRFGWGMLAMVAVLAPVWIGMFSTGGEEFREIVRFEFLGRVTGRGAVVPHGASAPAIAHLLYYMLPVTVFAAASLLLVRPGAWLSDKSPVFLPLCWIIAVVLPFSLTHGFRPDYLLPCYAGGAIMGAWAVEEVCRRGRGGGRAASAMRHLFAAVAIVLSLCVALVAAAFLYHGLLPASLAKGLKMPPVDVIRPWTWYIMPALVAAGVIGLATAILASLRWRVRTVTAVAIVGMLAVMFFDRHVLTTAAKTGDGERLVRFAMEARGKIAGESFSVYRAEKLGTEPYVGRFARRIGSADAYDELVKRGTEPARAAETHAEQALKALAGGKASWLVTCDRGLVELGAYRIDDHAEFKLKMDNGRKVRFRTDPDSFGTVVVQTQPIVSQEWGRVYLVRLDAGKLQALCLDRIWLQAEWTGHRSGKQDDDD